MRLMNIIVGFGSLLFIPFLGILNRFKVRAFPSLMMFLAVWLLLGMLAIGGGVTPISKGDIVTRDERQAWFDLPEVIFVKKLWFAGFALGIPLLVVTGLYEYCKNASIIFKRIRDISTITAFIGGLFAFIKFIIIPEFFP